MYPPHPTPEQRAALRESMARTAELFRQLVEGIRQLARQVVPAMRAFVDFVEGGRARDPRGLAYTAAGPRPRMTARTRPAWVSPYGPAPRRR